MQQKQGIWSELRFNLIAFRSSAGYFNPGPRTLLFLTSGMEKTSLETKVLTAEVPLTLADQVDEMAARLERSKGWIVRQALAAWIDQEEERHRLTLEALAEVDAGHVIDHQAVQAWAESLGSDKPLPVPN